MNIYLLVAISLALGFLLQRIPNVRETLTPALNNFAIYVALPAIILAKVPLLDITLDAIFIVGSAWGVMALSMSILIPLGRKLEWSKDTIIACVVLAGLGNTAFLGLALIKVFSNDQVLGFAVIYDQVGSFIILSLVFPIVSALRKQAGNEELSNAISKLRIVRNVLLFPPFVSLLVALFVPISQITESLQLPLKWLGLSLLPIAMLVVGMQLQLRIKKEYLLPSALVLGIKMFIAPFLVFGLGYALSIPKDIFSASVIQAAMPPMITPAIFLISLGFAPRLTATILGIGTLSSFVIIPTIALLLN